MIRKTVVIVLLLVLPKVFAQYSFEGQFQENGDNKTVYLSIIEDYRKLSRVYLEQIINQTTIDSLGFFEFEGDNLPETNRIYRIHVDECSNRTMDSNHFFGKCKNTKSILFIANNRDTVSFPTSFADEVLCEITSTNEKSAVFLEIDLLKEQMALDFNDFRSEANRKLNSEKWFSTLQDFGQNRDEPLAELYIFDFLSDKRNETYGYYLKDLAQNDYYAELGQRLEESYPNAPFTELYRTEIATDRQLTAKNQSSYASWKWILGGFLTLSLLLNAYLMARQKAIREKHRNGAVDKLTAQEQNIVREILKDKTNKEIASDLFISLSTVKTHINNLYKKLNVSSREEIKQLF